LGIWDCRLGDEGAEGAAVVEPAAAEDPADLVGDGVVGEDGAGGGIVLDEEPGGALVVEVACVDAFRDLLRRAGELQEQQ
jgi:hypothetical protein